jgi:hypothetical protein
VIDWRKYGKSELNTNNKLVPDRAKNYFLNTTSTDTVQLTRLQQVVKITNNHALTMRMPSVSEVKGISYTISVDTNGNAITLTDKRSDSSSWGGDYTLDAADDSITLRSNGQSWIEVSNDIS